MNVRFFNGTKEQYLSLATPRNPLGLYFCADTRELFWGDRLLTDGTRIIATEADLPELELAADGITYFVEDTRNGYVISSDRSKWITVIQAPESSVKAISFAGIEMEEVDGVFTIDRRCAREALGLIVPEGLEGEEIVIATEGFVKDEIAKIDIQGYATEQYVSDAIAAINPTVEEVKTKLETEVLPIVPAVQKVETEILPAVQELAENAATREWVDSQGYLTEHQSLEGLATEEFVRDEIANIKLPEVDTTNLVTTEILNNALATKADKVLFTTAKFVTNPVGNFVENENIAGLSLAELFAKLLGLVEEKPAEPEIPSEPTTIPEKIIAGELAMYSVTKDNILAATEFSITTFTPEEALAAPEKSGFYQIIDNGTLIESGYQDLVILSDETYYAIALPTILDYNTMVELQAYDTETKLWESYDKLALISEPAEVARLCDEASIDISQVNTDVYTIWVLEDVCTGSKLRYIIKEAE